jgi:N-acetylglucosamine-6-phosphate deacetylase
VSGHIILKGARVLNDAGQLQALDVSIVAGRIQEVGPGLSDADAVVLHLPGRIVAPGFIDTHIHGVLGDDTNDASVQALQNIARFLATRGVTAWLPTTVACSHTRLSEILHAIATVQAQAPTGAVVLGAHLESNFLSTRYKGAQPQAFLRACDDAALLEVIERQRKAIRVVTLAPELPGAIALIERLVALGIQVSVGHSDATAAQVQAAVRAGASRITHLCNAQRPFHHREPGVVGAGLVLDDVWAELIVDMVHVHPMGVEIARRCKGAQRLMLVSDALRGTGLSPGEYELGGQKTVIDHEIARLSDGTIAGSITPLDRAVRLAVGQAGVPLAEALTMASKTPAASLGLSDRGVLHPGYRADLVLLDDCLNVAGTCIGGEWVYTRDPAFRAGVAT